MLNNADLIAAIFAILSFIVMMVPLFNPPPKYPTKELEQDSVLAAQGAISSVAAGAFNRLNKEMYDSWILQRKCTAWGLLLLLVSVIWGLVGTALG